MSAMATHGSCPSPPPASKSRLSRVVVTNTLPISDEKHIEKLQVLSVAKLIADAIDAVFTSRPTSRWTSPTS